MANMYAKFDEGAHNSLVSILFTSLFPYMSIVTLTFDLQNQKDSSSGHSEYVCQVWCIGTQWSSFYRVHKVKVWRTHAHMDTRTLTDRTTAALLYPLYNGLRGGNYDYFSLYTVVWTW